MKIIIFIVVLYILPYNLAGQSSTALTNSDTANTALKYPAQNIDNNGFLFEIKETKANSKYNEFGAAIFRDKFVMVSSKKIGGLARVNKDTNQANKELYCLNINEDGTIEKPVLFSRILNTSNSEDQLCFSADESVVYYTRNSEALPNEYKIYRADLERNSNGNWKNHELLSINREGISIENPYLNTKGDKLYFSSNIEDSFGGFDIYVVDIKEDGTLGVPKNLGADVNTKFNDKYPSISKDDKYLFFASEGHNSIGGYDLFRSRILKKGIKKPRNLGNTINTSYDEVAYFKPADTRGYFSSNRPNGKGNFDIYLADYTEVKQSIKGTITQGETQIAIPNVQITLKDEDGNVLDKQISDERGSYTFKDITPFDVYYIETQKSGFENDSFEFIAEVGNPKEYSKNLELKPEVPELVAEDKLELENVYFDFNKYSIKEESYPTLDKVVEILNAQPNIKLSINAHTDNIDTEAYNLRLSKRRSKSILKYLLKKGIDKRRLFYKGFGESQPLVNCGDTCSEADLQANRRVEFTVISNGTENDINLNNNQGNFHIIAGAFSKKSNASRKIRLLKSEGFAGAKHIGVNKKEMHLVAYASYVTKEEAVKALELIRLINDENAWLKIRNL